MQNRHRAYATTASAVHASRRPHTPTLHFLTMTMGREAAQPTTGGVHWGPIQSPIAKVKTGIRCRGCMRSPSEEAPGGPNTSTPPPPPVPGARSMFPATAMRLSEQGSGSCFVVPPSCNLCASVDWLMAVWKPLAPLLRPEHPPFGSLKHHPDRGGCCSHCGGAAAQGLVGMVLPWGGGYRGAFCALCTKFVQDHAQPAY